MKKILYQTDQNNPAVRAYVQAVEKGKKDQHVLLKENGWIVKNLWSGEESKLFLSQQEAVSYAEAHASSGTTVFIHASTGLIDKRKEY